MRSLVAAVFSVATLLSVSSSAFAQGAQPGPGPAPAGAPGAAAPSPQIPSIYVDFQKRNTFWRVLDMGLICLVNNVLSYVSFFIHEPVG
jgi:hypothetical protein